MVSDALKINTTLTILDMWGDDNEKRMRKRNIVIHRCEKIVRLMMMEFLY